MFPHYFFFCRFSKKLLIVFLWGTVTDIFQTTPAATPRPIPMKASRTRVGRAVGWWWVGGGKVGKRG
jgi:hypothetical protein